MEIKVVVETGMGTLTYELPLSLGAQIEGLEPTAREAVVAHLSYVLKGVVLGIDIAWEAESGKGVAEFLQALENVMLPLMLKNLLTRITTGHTKTDSEGFEHPDSKTEIPSAFQKFIEDMDWDS
ncbi:MAG: hypothetical protein HYS15_02635 [Candidatus Spechtbacteria bacterium]|nr:hypothetical protein [Candidatus Spechtbacteria bacterium]